MPVLIGYRDNKSRSGDAEIVRFNQLANLFDTFDGEVAPFVLHLELIHGVLLGIADDKGDCRAGRTAMAFFQWQIIDDLVGFVWSVTTAHNIFSSFPPLNYTRLILFVWFTVP